MFTKAQDRFHVMEQRVAKGFKATLEAIGATVDDVYIGFNWELNIQVDLQKDTTDAMVKEVSTTVNMLVAKYFDGYDDIDIAINVDRVYRSS